MATTTQKLSTKAAIARGDDRQAEPMTLAQIADAAIPLIALERLRAFIAGNRATAD